MAVKKSATTAAKKDAPTKPAEAEPNEPTSGASPTKPAGANPTKPAEAKPSGPAAKPAAPHARPLFTGANGKTVRGAMAVLQVIDRYGPESGELAGLPRRLEVVGTFPTTSHTDAAAKARDAGVLAADADAVTLNPRFVSAVDVPREEEAAPGAARRRLMANPESAEIEFLRRFIAASDWTGARTMPKNPHAYVVRGRTADPAGFDRFVRAIAASGWRGEWGGRTWTYLDVDTHSYWVIGVVLNRKPVGDVPGDHGLATNP